MRKCNLWLFKGQLLLAFGLAGLMPCSGLEVLISDSGRNTAWTRALKPGDSFDAAGADKIPVGGVFNLSSPLGQFLLPMPEDLELSQMTKSQEDNLVREWGELIRDRVDIAVMNHEPNFEIRLLQNTPTPRNASDSWPENPNADRFARIAYAAITKTVAYLKERDTAVKITAALADTGAGTFARAVDAWRPYASSFRRADLVQGWAGLKETRDIIGVLGETRLRLFLNPSVESVPAMTVGRREIAQALAGEYPRLGVFQLTAIEKPSQDSNALLRNAGSHELLFGFGVFTYQRLTGMSAQARPQPVVVDSLSRFLTPDRGWDPQNTYLDSTTATEDMGLVASIHPTTTVPPCESPSGEASMLVQTSSPNSYQNSGAITWDHVAVTLDNAKLVLTDTSAIGDSLSTLKHFQGTGLLQAPENVQMLEKALGVGHDPFNNLMKSFGVAGNVLDLTRSVQNDIQNSQNSRTVSLPVNTLNSIVDTFVKLDPDLKVIPTDALLGLKNAAVREAQIGHPDIESLQMKMDAVAQGLAWVAGGAKGLETVVAKDPLMLVEKPQAAMALVTASANTASAMAGATITSASLGSRNWGLWNDINRANPLDADSRAFPQRMMQLADLNQQNQIRQSISQSDQTITKTYSQLKQMNASFNPPVSDFSRTTPTLNTGSLTRDFSASVASAVGGSCASMMQANNTVFDSLAGATRETTSMFLEKQGLNVKAGTGFGGAMNLTSFDSSFRPNFGPLTLPNSSFLTPQEMKFNTPNTLSFADSLNVKGVLLRGAARVEGEPVNADELGLVFQDANGVTDFDKLRRLATAMWAAYFSVEGPGISIDPIDPHVNKHHVRHIGEVRNTDLGSVMRETDYMMKRWAVGMARPDIPSFKNVDEISQKTGNRVIGRPSRFWLIPQGIGFKRAAGMLVLSSGRMTVQTEYLDDNGSGEKNPENEMFAEWFTEHYDEISAQYPMYQELFEYAQLVSLCTYLKEQKLPLLWFLLKNREMILTEHAIDYMPALAKKASKWYINISGGVELEATKTVRDQANISDDTSLAKSVAQARADSGNKPGSDQQVSVTESNTTYTVSQAGSLSLSGTRAIGDIVQTDYSHFDEYAETEGTNSSKLVTPGLELIRHYSPELTSKAQFGPGWHLAVPFHLTAGGNVALQPDSPPRNLELHNVLSGEMEAMQFSRITNNGVERFAYVPVRKKRFCDHVAYADGTWHLQDCLGVNLWFDSDGKLKKMELRPDTEIQVKLGEKVLHKTIPGYSVAYDYGTGSDGRKRLESIKQGASQAIMQWDESAGASRIAGIQVKREGAPAELIQYQYGADGQLATVRARNGIIKIQYQDNGMRVAAINQ